MIVLILASGKQERFLGFPHAKQILVIAGEMIISRQHRQLSEIGLIPHVISNKEQIEKYYPCFKPSDDSGILRTLLSCSTLWLNNETTILLGDVFYSPQAIKIIITNKKPLCFFRNCSEIFAFRFDAETSHKIKEYAEECSEIVGYHGARLWHIYRRCSGRDIHTHEEFESEIAEIISDYTTDVDSQTQYEDVKKSIEALGSQQTQQVIAHIFTPPTSQIQLP
jgi:molybdopterin-guanine dinucleotide biosynthesis protein A